MSRRFHCLAFAPELALAVALAGGAMTFVAVSPAGAVDGPTVTATAVTDITLATATLNGTVNPNGVPTSYYFVYEPESGLPSVTTPPTAVGSGTSPVAVSVEAIGLMPDATYWVWLYATDANNVTSKSNNVTFTTSDGTSPETSPGTSSGGSSGGSSGTTSGGSSGTTSGGSSGMTSGGSSGATSGGASGGASGTNALASPKAKAIAAATSLQRGLRSPKIVIDSAGIVLATAKPVTVPVKLTCAIASCSGTVWLQSAVSRTGLLASAPYRIANGKSAIVALRFTSTGRAVLAYVAKKPRTEILIATVKGGTRAEKRPLVSVRRKQRHQGQTITTRVPYFR